MAHFGSIFPIFGVKKIFLENPALSCTTSYGFLAPCQNLEKVNDTIQRKRPDRRTDRRTDRPYFIGHFRLPPGVQKRQEFHEGNCLTYIRAWSSYKLRKKIHIPWQLWAKTFISFDFEFFRGPSPQLLTLDMSLYLLDMSWTFS